MASKKRKIVLRLVVTADFSQEVPYSLWNFAFKKKYMCLATFTKAIMAFDETKQCNKFKLPEMPQQ